MLLIGEVSENKCGLSGASMGDLTVFLSNWGLKL